MSDWIICRRQSKLGIVDRPLAAVVAIAAPLPTIVIEIVFAGNSENDTALFAGV